MPNAGREVAATEESLPVVKYLCVCGNEMLAARHSAGTCNACGRRISLVDADPAVTIELSPSDSDALQEPREHAPLTLNRDGSAEVLGHYRIVEPLGCGGMGAVYRALDESLKRYVALKVIRSPAATSVGSQHVQRLLQEAIAQARVNHPNIVHIYFVGTQSGAPFFAMELVSGCTLAEQLQRGPLTFDEIVDYTQQIVSALEHAAELDILHGDIKPGNILLTEGRAVKLSDFGLARRLSEIADPQEGLSGTPDYLAPEAIAGDAVDIRSDMYSLGVTLFEMTFGRLPYASSGSSVIDRLRAHREQSVDFPVPWPEDLPLAWRDVLARLLEKAPADRYASYAELCADLQRLKPVVLHTAGRVPRALAWVVDLALVNTVDQIITAPLEFDVDGHPHAGRVLQVSLSLLSAAAIVLIAWGHTYWRRTPGKKLFQLRIVDRHGLKPSRTVLFSRALFQLCPAWAGISLILLPALGLNLIGQIVAGTFAALAIADAGCAFFHRRTKSLHDLLFRTSVVLDTETTLTQDVSGGGAKK